AEFYLNPDNISFGMSPLIEKLARGIVVYSIRRGEVEAALRFFNMVHPSRRSLQKKYHELARLYHPDMVKGSDGMMKQLNSHYQILLEVFLV
ncbi:MAG TPA: J domain-containing protein, partial [Spirochaetota bacterium]|nr:J domain-containing protein [Spirochaetota bacterium]